MDYEKRAKIFESGDFTKSCSIIKEEIIGLNSWLIQLRNFPKLEGSTEELTCCCPRANILLAYRHLEDAAMRLDWAAHMEESLRPTTT